MFSFREPIRTCLWEVGEGVSADNSCLEAHGALTYESWKFLNQLLSLHSLKKCDHSQCLAVSVRRNSQKSQTCLHAELRWVSDKWGNMFSVIWVEQWRSNNLLFSPKKWHLNQVQCDCKHKLMARPWFGHWTHELSAAVQHVTAAHVDDTCT